LLASLWCPNDPAWAGRYWQLWSLRLDPTGGTIVEAEPLIDPDLPGAPWAWYEQRLPAAGPSHDGRRCLAFVLRPRASSTSDLWLAPVAGGGAGGCPRVQATAARKLSAECELVEPAFSRDGRWVYATIRGASIGEVRVERFPVDAGDRGTAGAAGSGEAADES
jgi:hypothetical protein